MNAFPYYFRSNRKTRAATFKLPGRLLLGVLVASMFGAVDEARAIDYGFSAGVGGRSGSGHATIDDGMSTIAFAGTGGITFEICTGETGCCCTNNCESCSDVVGTQTCCSTGDCADMPGDCDGAAVCEVCCHADAEANTHQSCCADNGDPDGDICCGTGPPCTLKINVAGVCHRSSCTGSADIVATICDDTDGDPLNNCPPAGDRVDVTLPLGKGPITDQFLCDMHTCQLAVYVEYTDATSLVLPIYHSDDWDKWFMPFSDPEFECPTVPNGCMDPVPTVSEWGLAVMVLLMLTAGTVVLIRQRRAAQL
jgi:hypothetical protein